MARTIGKAEMQKAAIEVGRRLRAIRKAQGFTTWTLAKGMHLSQAQVSRLENGLQGLRAVVILRACSVLKISPVVLFIEKPLAKALLKSPLGKKFRGLNHVV